MKAIDHLQFNFLPFGSLLLIAVVGLLFLLRRQFKQSEVVAILLSGASAGLLVVGVLYFSREALNKSHPV